MSLSPGQYHKLVDKSLLGNLHFRKFILEACAEPNIRAGVMEMCKRDILFFINVFVYQINPRHTSNEVGPFITWDFQDEGVLASVIQLFGDGDVPGDDMVWEKSREMGATWLACIIALWLCLFHPNKRVLCMSHSEQAVDKAGNLGSLFAKINFILERLPKWMSRRAHKRKLSYVFDGGSSIGGVSSTVRSGVGDRVALVILDEFSKYIQAAEIIGQTRDTGPRLFIGTHYGVGTVYAELCERPDIHKIIFHWSQHPEKRKGLYESGTATGFRVIDTSFEYPTDFNYVMDGSPTGGPFKGIRSPWYDKECSARRNARDVAMHLDIDPKGSTSQFFDRMVIVDLKRKCVEPWFVGDISYEPGSGKPLEFVRREGGPLRLWCNLDLDGRPPLARYGGGSDLSAGTGATPTCLAIWNADVGTKAAEYITPRVKPEAFAIVAYALCLMFKSTSGTGMKLCWEANGPGLAFSPAFMAFGYQNVHFREKNAGIQGDQFVSVTTTPGWWNPNNAAIEAILAPYEAGLRSGQLTNYSEYALDECLSYAYDKMGKISHSKRRSPLDPSGARENHGDIVIADALAVKMVLSIGAVTRVVEAEPPPSIYTLGGRRRLWEMRQRSLATQD